MPFIKVCCRLCAVVGMALFLLVAAPNIRAEATEQEPKISRTDAALLQNAQNLYRQKHYRQARDVLENFLNGKKPHSFVLTLYGLCAMGEDNFPLAAEVFGRGAKLYPSNFALHHNLAVALHSDNRVLEAAEVFARAVNLTKSEEVGNRLKRSAAAAYYQGEAFAKVRPILGRLAASDSLDVEALKLAGAADIRLEKWSSAEAVFFKLTRLVPSERSYWQSLASIRIARKRRQSAVPALEMAAQLAQIQCQRQKACVATKELRRSAAQLYATVNAPRLELHSLTELSGIDWMPAESDENLRVGHNKKGLTHKQRESEGQHRYLEKILDAQMKTGRREAALKTLDAMDALKTSRDNAAIRGGVLYQLGRLEQAQSAYLAGGDGDGLGAQRNRFYGALIAWERGQRTVSKQLFKKITGDSGLRRQAEACIATIEQLERLEAEINLFDHSDIEPNNPVLLAR